MSGTARMFLFNFAKGIGILTAFGLFVFTPLFLVVSGIWWGAFLGLPVVVFLVWVLGATW